MEKFKENLQKKMFSKIGLSHILGIFNTRFGAKNQEKQMMKSRENAKIPVFPAYFRHFPRKKFFSKNRAPSHFWNCHFASLCQKSEKTYEPISRKAGNRLLQTDGRTDGQRLIYRTSEVGPTKW